MTSTATTTYTATMGRGTAIHAADAHGILCNRWGTNTGKVVAPQIVTGVEVTCKRCLRLAPAPVVVEAPAARPARTWDATTTTTHVCAGACGQELPATSYPTTGKPGLRGVVCRKDRDAARTA